LNSARLDQDYSLKATATWAWCQLGRYQELGLVIVEAGDFLMGSTNEDQYAGAEEKPQHTVYLSNYFIGKNPITVAGYRVFIQESGYKTSDDRSVKGVDNHPVVYVSRADAVKFAQWHGMTLPTESQWEKAARGTDGRIYPWGNDWRENHASTSEYWGKPRNWWERLRKRNTSSGTTPIGSFSPRGDSPYGCVDMSGNVWEWCNDWYDQNEYKNRADTSVKDPQGPQEGRYRVLRGGSFVNIHRSARCANRNRNFPDDFGRNYGFRVCVSPILKSEL
jgi:iron(II)-dependent oxidoreductase